MILSLPSNMYVALINNSYLWYAYNMTVSIGTMYHVDWKKLTFVNK